MSLITYLIIAAVSGAVWSAIQFVAKYVDTTNKTIRSLADWSWLMFAWTITLNVVGGVAGVLAYPYLGVGDGVVTPLVAILSGIVGEKVFIILKGIVGRVFPGATGENP